jgi:hypothetical protein
MRGKNGITRLARTAFARSATWYETHTWQRFTKLSAH